MSDGATTRDGFAVLWVAIKREPWIFTLSTIGSVLFGALTVADAWVLGWSTDHVVLPAFENGEIGTELLVAVLALFLGVALLRAVGIVARRLGAGDHAVPHAGALPPRGHPPVPLASRWSGTSGTRPASCCPTPTPTSRPPGAPIAPLPMAVGTVAMMVIAVVQMFLADVVLAMVGLLVFPAVIVANLALPAARLAADDPGPGSCAPRSARSPTSPSTARWWSRRWAARARRPTGSRAKAQRAARRQHPRRPDPRGVRPDPRRAAQPRRPASCSRSASARVLSGATDAGDVVTVAYLLTIVSFPIRSIGWLLGEFPRSVVGYRRVQPGARRDRRDAVRRPPRCPPAPTRRPARGRRTSATPTTPSQRLLDDVDVHRRARAAPSRSSARPPPARAR